MAFQVKNVYYNHDNLWVVYIFTNLYPEVPLMEKVTCLNKILHWLTEHRLTRLFEKAEDIGEYVSDNNDTDPINIEELDDFRF